MSTEAIVLQLLRVTHHSLRLAPVTKEVLGPEENLLLLLTYIDIISNFVPNSCNYSNRQGFFSALFSNTFLGLIEYYRMGMEGE